METGEIVVAKDAKKGNKFDGLSINENTAEDAKKAKQTNRSRGLFELPPRSPAPGISCTFLML